MITVRPFQPVGNTGNSAVTGTAATITIPTVPRGTSSVRLVLAGATAPAFILFAKTAAEAAAVTAATGFPMLGGTVESFQLRNDQLFVGVIGTDGTLYVTSGESA